MIPMATHFCGCGCEIKPRTFLCYGTVRVRCNNIYHEYTLQCGTYHICMVRCGDGSDVNTHYNVVHIYVWFVVVTGVNVTKGGDAVTRRANKAFLET